MLLRSIILAPLAALGAALLGAGALGCSGHGEQPNVESPSPLTQELVDDATETSQASSHSVTLGKIFVVALDKASAATVTAAASKVASSPPEIPLAGFLPAGCAQLTRQQRPACPVLRLHPRRGSAPPERRPRRHLQ